MQKLLVALVAIGALFVWLTSSGLSATVASHFGASGEPNGFMPRTAYVYLMLGLVVALPLLVARSGRLVARLPASSINLPNKSYWLAPERHAGTVRSISDWLVGFAILLLLLLCYVHWLVVQANTGVTKQLSSVPFMLGLALFLVATIAWLIAFYRRFANVP